MKGNAVINDDISVKSVDDDDAYFPPRVYVNWGEKEANGTLSSSFAVLVSVRSEAAPLPDE